MQSFFIAAAIVAASTSSVYAYQCPDTTSVNRACDSLSVRPLVCNNPNGNKDACNAKQCNQTYVDNYAACQCRRSLEQFYEHAANVEGLLKRCGVAGLSNPYGNPNQYRPGQGTAIFIPPSSANDDVNGGASTQVWGGTTYYGGTATVVDGTTHWADATAVVRGTTLVGGTTTWVSGTPGVIGGASSGVATHSAGTTRAASVVISITAAPVAGPTESPVPVNNQSQKLSGGAIAGIVLGCLAASAIAGLLAWCWRKNRHQHTTVYNQHSTYDNREPTRTVVTEKIEPVVVKTGTTNYNTGTPGNTTYTTSTTTPVNNYSTGANYDSNTHPTTSFNTMTTTNTGYNANNAYNSGRNVVDGAQNAANTAYNAGHNATNSTYNAGRDASNAVGNGARTAGNAASNAMH